MWLVGCAGWAMQILWGSEVAIAKRNFDVVVVGAGGAGLRAALQLAEGWLSVAVLSRFSRRARTRWRRRADRCGARQTWARTRGCGTCTIR